MKPLKPHDQQFLWIEKRQQPMHVAGLLLFSYPEDAGPDYVTELANQLRSYTKPEEPFNQRLVTRFGQYYWEEDKQFDLEHHFRHEALPAPGRIRELLARVSAEHSNLMDRERPLWEYHLIEGFSDRRFAVYFKIHHAMTDGISGIRMQMRSLSTDENSRGNPPIWAMPPREKKAIKEKTSRISRFVSTVNGVGQQLATAPILLREAIRAVKKDKYDTDHVSVFQAPQSILNESITGSRRFAAQSYSLTRIKNVSKSLGVTLNDVVLAVCSSALREYLLSLDALPNKALVSMVPMSVRTDDSEGGNQIAMILANLATDIADPLERLSLITASVKESKQRFKKMSKIALMNYTGLMMVPAIFNMLTSLAPKWQTFNVTISNVPGPKETLYFNGAKLEGIYPLSIPMNRNALNITLLSYDGQLEFGLTGCRRTLPSMQRLLDLIEDGIVELEHIIETGKAKPSLTAVG